MVFEPLEEHLLVAECSSPFAIAIGDFNRQFLGQMTQLNQLLGEVKDLLRQQVTTRMQHQKTLVLPDQLIVRASGTAGKAGRPTSGGPVHPPSWRCVRRALEMGDRCVRNTMVLSSKHSLKKCLLDCYK